MENNVNIEPKIWDANNHPKYTVWLNYLDGTLNETTTIALEIHLEGCLSCSTKVSEINLLLVEHKGDVSALRKQIDTNAQNSMQSIIDSGIIKGSEKSIQRIIPLKRIKFATGIAAGILLFIAFQIFSRTEGFKQNYIPVALHVSANDNNTTRFIDQSVNKEFNLGVNKFINKEYLLAKESFELVIISNNSAEDQISFANAYLGLIEMHENPSNQKVIAENFKQAYESGNDSIKAIASFFLGNIAFNEKKYEVAKEFYNNFEQNKFYLQLTQKEEKIFEKVLKNLE